MPCVMGALPSSTSRATEAVLTRAPVNCTLLRRLAALYDSTSPSSYLTMTGYRPASVHEMTVPTYARPSSNVLRTRSPTCAAACGAMSFSREKGEKGRGERERGAYATLTLLLQSCGAYLHDQEWGPYRWETTKGKYLLQHIVFRVLE